MTAGSPVSIVIVTWNRREELLVCLASLERLTHPAVEIIVLDNASADGTAEAVRLRHPSVWLFRAWKNLGTSVGRNVACHHARGDFLWFLDSDTVVEDANAVEQYLALFADRPELGGAGGESLRREDGTIAGYKAMRLCANGLTRSERVPDAVGRCDADVIPTCNLFMPRAIFERVGGFDPLFFFYLEDLDLCQRVRRAGLALSAGALPRVWHKMAEASGRRSHLLAKRNRMFFAVKHFSPGALLALPFQDMLYVVAPDRLRTILRASRLTERDITALTEPDGRRRPTVMGLFNAVRKGLAVVASLPASYVLALPHLAAMCATRRRQVGAFADTDPALVEPFPLPRGEAKPAAR